MPEQYQANDNSIAVYLNGFGHVTTSVRLKVEKGIAQVVGIPSEFMLESLHTILDSSDVGIRSARVVEPTTLEELARNSIGKSIMDLARNGKDVTALTVHGNNLLVQDSEHAGCVYSKSLESFKYPENSVDIKQRQAVELGLQGLEDGTESTLGFSYLTEGIGLSPFYTIRLKGDKLQLTADVEVDNKTGKPYEKVDLDIIPGEVEMPELISRVSGGRIRRIRRPLPVEEVMSLDAIEEVSAFEEGGQVGYAMGKRDLPLGKSRFALFGASGLDYEIAYSTSIQHGESFSSWMKMRPEISTVLRFKAPIILPVGGVAVYSERPGLEKGKVIERYEGGGSIENPVLKDEKVRVALRTPDTLEMKVEQVGEPLIVNTEKGTKDKPIYAVQREFRVTTKNAGEENAVIETDLHLAPFQSLIDTSLTADISRRNPKWNVQVEAGKTTEFNYTVQNLGYSPVSQSELIRLFKGAESSPSEEEYV